MKIFFLVSYILMVSLLGCAQVQVSPSGLIPISKKGKWGYCDRNKKMVTLCVFDSAYPFDCVNQNGKLKPYVYAVVYLKNKIYHINAEGELTDPKQTNSKIYHVNAKGEITNPVSEEMYDYKIELDTNGEIKRDSAIKADESEDEVKGKMVVTTPKLYSYKNVQYEIVQRTFYDAVIKKDNRFGTARIYGGKELILPLEFDTIILPPSSRNVYITKNVNGWGLYNYQAKVLDKYDEIRYIFQKATGYNEPYDAILFARKGKYFTFYDKWGKSLSWGEFEDLKFNGNVLSMFAVKKEGKWGIINNHGKIVISFKYEEIDIDNLQCMLFKVKKMNKIGYVDCRGVEYF
jgi:WG containing repeat